MKKLLFTTALVLGAAVALPAAGLAATYQYVDTQGNMASVEASTGEQALMIAPNKAYNSGVMLVTSVNEIPDSVEVSL